MTCRVRSSWRWSPWRCLWSLRWEDTSFQRSPSRDEETAGSLKTSFVFIFVSPSPTPHFFWPRPLSVSPLDNRHGPKPLQEIHQPTCCKEGKDGNSRRPPPFQVPSLAPRFRQSSKPDGLQKCCVITTRRCMETPPPSHTHTDT